MTRLNSNYPVAAFTVACGKAALEEAKACEASFRYWHPDIPFLCIDESRYRLLSGGNPPAWSGEVVSMRSLAGWFLSQRVDRLIYLDSDLFVLGRLDKLVDGDATSATALTSDIAAYTMGLPECPSINSGVLASSDPLFWQTWTASQYGCLLPALDRFYFNQLSLRILVGAGAIRAEVIDGKPGTPFYNVSVGDQSGEWQVRNSACFKGDERALVYHQAGMDRRGIGVAPQPLQPWLEAITTANNHQKAPCLDFEAWWQEDGEVFMARLKELFPRWPTLTLDGILADAYARTPGKFRTVAPSAWDRHRSLEGTTLQRFWNRQWQAYLYCQQQAR